MSGRVAVDIVTGETKCLDTATGGGTVVVFTAPLVVLVLFNTYLATSKTVSTLKGSSG